MRPTPRSYTLPHLDLILKTFFNFDHQLPVILSHLIPEMLLSKRINALPGDLGTQLVGVIKVPSVHDVFLSCRSVRSLHIQCLLGEPLVTNFPLLFWMLAT